MHVRESLDNGRQIEIRMEKLNLIVGQGQGNAMVVRSQSDVHGSATEPRQELFNLRSIHCPLDQNKLLSSGIEMTSELGERDRANWSGVPVVHSADHLRTE